MRRRRSLAALLPLIALLLTAGPIGSVAHARPVIMTTTTILADMTREVAGDAVEVQCLVPPGVDLHGFDPTPRDIAPLLAADLVVSNGAGFEPWLPRFLAASGYTGPTIAAIDGCTKLVGAEDAHDHDHEHVDDGHDHGGPTDGHVDPHAWHNPACAIRYVANIRDALLRLDPDNAENYRRRARLYSAQIETVDAWARRLFAAVPPERKRIVTAHDALAYFGRAYAIEILPLRGLDSRAEPDARHTASIVDALRAAKAAALFGETVTDPRTLAQIARDTGATLGTELLTDSLAAPGQPGSTYLGMLRENTLRILAAIEPAAGAPAR